MPEFNIGDILRIRDYEDMKADHILGFVPDMKYLCGQRFTVKSNTKLYHSEEGIEGGWAIIADMLEYDDVEEIKDIDSKAFFGVLSG